MPFKALKPIANAIRLRPRRTAREFRAASEVVISIRLSIFHLSLISFVDPFLVSTLIEIGRFVSALVNCCAKCVAQSLRERRVMTLKLFYSIAMLVTLAVAGNAQRSTDRESSLRERALRLEPFIED